jgi:hypothetical protein
MVGVTVGVTLGDLRVPPGVSGFDLVLLAGPGCGSTLGWGPAEEPGLGWGSGGGLALGLGWELGSGAVDWLAEAVAAAWLPCAETDPCPAGACVPSCLLRWAAWARSTGMPAGCCARAPVCAAGRVRALVLAVAEDVQEFELSWRVPCTPVSSMFTAP